MTGGLIPVQFTPQADAWLGMEIRQDPNCKEYLLPIVNEVIVELRHNKAWLYLVTSEIVQEAYELYHPPYRFHFRKLDDPDRIHVVCIDRIAPRD